MYWLIVIATFLGVVGRTRATQGRLFTGSEPYPSCQANSATLCAATNVLNMVQAVGDALKGGSVDGILSTVNAGGFNVVDGFGFSPFVFEVQTNLSDSLCVANGRNTSLNGFTVAGIVDKLVDTDQLGLLDEMWSSEDGWFRFIWLAETANSVPYPHNGYGVKVTNAISSKVFYVFGAYSTRRLERLHALNCPTSTAALCNIVNIRSIVGDALTQMLTAPDLQRLRELFTDMTFGTSTRWKEGGYYTYAYEFGEDSRNICLAQRVGSWLGLTMPGIFESVNLNPDLGAGLHGLFSSDSAGGGGWTQYLWRTNPSNPATSKVSFLAGVRRFGVSYYVGTGFNHVRQPRLAGPACNCNRNMSQPCSLANILSLISFSEVEMLTDISAVDGFAKLTNDEQFKMEGGFHVLVVSFNGTCVAHGGKPSNVGLHVENIGVDNATHTMFINAANRGTGWLMYGDSQVGYVVKISKDSHQYYALSSYAWDRSVVETQSCSPLYNSPCAELEVMSLVGHFVSVVQTTTSSQDLINELSKLATGNGTFDVIMLDSNFNVVGQRLNESFIPTLIHQNIAKIGPEIRNNGLLPAGGWIPKSLSGGKRIFVKSAAFFVPDEGMEQPSTHYVLSSFDDNPKPPDCGTCPEKSWCNSNTGLCQCGNYFLPSYQNVSHECTEAISSGWTMSCVDDSSKSQLLTVKAVCRAMLTLNILIATLSFCWALINRKHPVVVASQAPFLLLVSIGTIVSSISIYLFTVDDQYGYSAGPLGENTSANFACMAQVYTYCIGFMLTFATLFVKLYRINAVFSQMDNMFSGKKGKRGLTVTHVKERDMLLALVGMVSVDIIIASIWASSDPLTFTDTGIGSPGCSSSTSGTYITTIAIYHLFMLLLGSVYSYRCRNVSDAFSEAKYVSIAMFSNLQIYVLAVPLLFLVSSDPTSNMFIRSGVVALNDLSVQLLIFLPKIQMWRTASDTFIKDVVADMCSSKGSSALTSARVRPSPNAQTTLAPTSTAI
mmetsp:Transcript_19656/g.32767  ORF Transcript_19656/g.32767 Transcript_19656/m.32767 type:complete len:1002 (+) Transcript_19656:327-3332(+)